MTILFLGDLFGKPGLRILKDRLHSLVDRHRADFTVVNVENAADGSGVTPEIAESILALGADCLTTGNHAFDRREILDYFTEQPRLLRPLNCAPGTPGKGLYVGETASGTKVAVMNLIGRVHMPGAADCPFRAADAAVAAGFGGAKVLLVDMHGEATSEKAAMGAHLDGRASAVLGTHTHVQTADEAILPRGTAFITDAGMTGPSSGVIGGDREAALRRFVTQMPGRIPAATGAARLHGVVVTVEATSGRATGIRRLALGEDDA